MEETLANCRLKQPARPVTAPALGATGLTLALVKARAAAALAAAYPEADTRVEH